MKQVTKLHDFYRMTMKLYVESVGGMENFEKMLQDEYTSGRITKGQKFTLMQNVGQASMEHYLFNGIKY